MDSEINMIPMIDLLMVTISFLLITAVWTHASRINADASVPGPDPVAGRPVAEKQLHVMMQAQDTFVLVWKQGTTTVDAVEVPRNEVWTREYGAEVVRYPDLAARVEAEWRARGQHASPTDPKRDQAVLHAGNETQFKYLIGVIDAIYRPHRDVRVASGRTEKAPAFNVVFAVD